MGKPLPDPYWSEAPAACYGCGYSLEGHAAPGVCPECGMPFERGCLTLAGVPRRSGGPVWRKLGWGAVLFAAVVYSQVFPLLLFWKWWIAVVVLVLIIAGAVWLVLTSPRERRGVERILVTQGGLVRAPLEVRANDTRLDSIVVPWGDADTVELERISAVWRRLRVGSSRRRGASPLGWAILDAGIRCPDASAEAVTAEIRRRLDEAGQPGGAVSAAIDPRGGPAALSACPGCSAGPPGRMTPPGPGR